MRAFLTPSDDCTLCEALPPRLTTPAINYFSKLLRILTTDAEQTHLTAGYVYGSLLREDFVAGTSDIDILLAG
jgi:hypothetical protein